MASSPNPSFFFPFFWRTAHKCTSVACALLEFIHSLYVDKEWLSVRIFLIIPQRSKADGQTK